MLQTSRVVEQVADRIERAYLRRRPEWRQANLDPRLWSAAAAVLLDAHGRESWVPVDPELFVASQFAASISSDPWSELTRASSRRRYVAQVRRIVRSLRRELREELRRGEAALRQGDALEVILLGPSRHLTPLGRYLIACRHDRQDLADRFRPEARDQHWACPLYRAASRGLVAEAAYPVTPILPEFTRPPSLLDYSLN